MFSLRRAVYIFFIFYFILLMGDQLVPEEGLSVPKVIITTRLTRIKKKKRER